MSFFTQAFTDLDDPYYACYYGITTHPKYHKCDDCPSSSRCDKKDLLLLSSLTKAFTDLDDPYHACYYGVTTHPKYHKCDDCPSKLLGCELTDDD